MENKMMREIVTAYRVLVACAQQKKIITYGEMAHEIGVSNAQHVGRRLYPIAVHLRLSGLPALTVLVVRKGDGKPGPGLPTSQQTASETVREVFKEPWDPNLFDPLLEE